MVVSKTSYTLALINAWFSMLGCGTAAVLLVVILPNQFVLFAASIFTFAAVFNLITSVQLWKHVTR